MNILIHTWDLSKYRGSEFSVSYNYIKSMEKYHKLFVAFASNSYEREDYSELKELTEELTNCTFITIKPNSYMKLCKKIEAKFPSYINNIIKYAYYKEWEKRLYSYIKTSNFINSIDCIHYVGPAGYHEPGYLWKLKKPYIWGAISGFENINKVLAKKLFARKFVLYTKKYLNILTIKFNPRIRKALEKTDIVVAATISNKQIIESNFKCRKVMYFPENLMRISKDDILSTEYLKDKYSNVKKLTILWIGNIEPRKMPNLLIDSLRCIKSKNIQVYCIGGGSSFIKDNCDIGFVKFINKIPRDEVEKYWKIAHLHIITSAHEANTTVLFEAMEHCVPTLTTDICGMHDIVKDNTGIKIPVDTYQNVVQNIAEKIDFVAENPNQLYKMACNLRLDSFNYVKEIRAKYYNDLYMNLINKSTIL